MMGVAARPEKAQRHKHARKLRAIAQEIASRTRLRVSSAVRIFGLLRSGERDLQEEMRDLCLATKERFTESGIAPTVTFTTTEDFPSATRRHAHRHAESLGVIAQDREFLLAELFCGPFTKAVLHRVLSPVLTIPARP